MSYIVDMIIKNYYFKLDGGIMKKIILVIFLLTGCAKEAAPIENEVIKKYDVEVIQDLYQNYNNHFGGIYYGDDAIVVCYTDGLPLEVIEGINNHTGYPVLSTELVEFSETELIGIKDAIWNSNLDGSIWAVGINIQKNTVTVSTSSEDDLIKYQYYIEQGSAEFEVGENNISY